MRFPLGWNDAHQSLVLHDFQAQPAELFALHRGLELVESLWIEIGRMRVERGEHAADRRLDHFRAIRRVDIEIVFAGLLEDLFEERQPFGPRRSDRGAHYAAGQHSRNTHRGAQKQIRKSARHRARFLAFSSA